MRVFWCTTHRAAESAEEGTCEVAGCLWNLSRSGPADACTLIEEQLVSTTPTGYLVYGEFIPYDIFWKHSPFAAPVDQVVALYAEEGP